MDIHSVISTAFICLFGPTWVCRPWIRRNPNELSSFEGVNLQWLCQGLIIIGVLVSFLAGSFWLAGHPHTSIFMWGAVASIGSLIVGYLQVSYIKWNSQRRSHKKTYSQW